LHRIQEEPQFAQDQGIAEAHSKAYHSSTKGGQLVLLSLIRQSLRGMVPSLRAENCGGGCCGWYSTGRLRLEHN